MLYGSVHCEHVLAYNVSILNGGPKIVSELQNMHTLMTKQSISGRVLGMYIYICAHMKIIMHKTMNHCTCPVYTHGPGYVCVCVVIMVVVVVVSGLSWVGPIQYMKT